METAWTPSLRGRVVLTTGSRPASLVRREEPSTPVQDVRTPSGASNAAARFVIPLSKKETASSFRLPLPTAFPLRLSASSGCSDTATPPGSPHFHGMSAQPTRVTNEQDNYFLGGGDGKKNERKSSFSHERCLNCNSQFIVNTSSPPCNPTRSINGEFCSGECRCSFLASAIDRQYCKNETKVYEGMIVEDMLDSSEDDEW